MSSASHYERNSDVTDNSFHLVKLFRERVSRYQDRCALKFREAGQWHDMSWSVFGARVEALSKALIAAGIGVQDRVGICSNNMPEWSITDFAILNARGVTVPVYPTNTPKQVEYILKDAEISILFVGEQEQYDGAISLLDGESDLSRVIALDSKVDLRGCPQGCHLDAFVAESMSVEAETTAELTHRIDQIDMTDLVTLIYTSGTTGEPKGVMLDYVNFGTTIRLHDDRIKVDESDTSLAFLPLSHVFERAWSFYVFYRGAVNVYMRDPAAVKQVVAEVKPTIMCAVPRFYEKIHAAVHTGVAKASFGKRLIFNTALKIGTRRFLRQRAGQRISPLLTIANRVADKMVFSKLRNLVGGRIRLFPCAGARLDNDIQLFFQAIGLRINYGYGLTETTATVSCYDGDNYRFGTIGTPLPEIDVRIGDNDEIQVRGDTVMRGYYRKPTANAEAFVDGWLRTGDAGYIDEDGNIVMTERLKELMKTSGGKYIAPQVVEGAIIRDLFVEQVAIVADTRKYVSALIVPAFEALEEYAHSIGLKFENRMDLIRNSHIQELFTERLEKIQIELARFEKVKKFTLLDREFSLELGEITPTLKLRRKIILQRFRREIDAMYSGA